jgi:hypothetical protein
MFVSEMADNRGRDKTKCPGLLYGSFVFNIVMCGVWPINIACREDDVCQQKNARKKS